MWVLLFMLPPGYGPAPAPEAAAEAADFNGYRRHD
jgi:hypothetical protein